MKSKDFLEELLKSYTSTFDLYRPYVIGDEEYPAYGYFFSHIEKYVLVREANLWEANSYEHVLFQEYEEPMRPEQVAHLRAVVEEYVEPQLVRKGEKTMPENHMYSYITCVALCSGGIPRETIRAVRRFKFEKGYQFNVRGYSQGRIIAVDLDKGKLYTNFQGRKLKKHYRTVLEKFMQGDS